MKRNNKITPEGTRDILFEECRHIRLVEQTLQQLFLRHGFLEVRTPGLEFYDVFTGDSIYFPQESVYKLVDPKGRILVLTPDLTAPTARLLATKLSNEPLPVRIFYNRNVFKVTGATGRHSDEITQIGVELAGSGTVRADLELLALAGRALSGVTKGRATIEIGHIGYFKALARQLPLPDEDREELRQLIKQKNYGAVNDMLRILPDSAAVTALRQLPRLFGGVEVLDRARALFDDDTTGPILDYLRGIYDDVHKLGLPIDVTVDLGLVGGISYYTGLVFKGYLEDVGREVLSGGRYDNLIEGFGLPLPSIGFAINVNEVASLNMKSESRPVPDVLVHAVNGYYLDGLLYADRLIERGLVCETSVFDSETDARAYAKRKGIGRLVIVNEPVTSGTELREVNV